MVSPMAQLLLQGGLFTLFSSAFAYQNPRWAKPMLTLGLVALSVGLAGRGIHSGSFHLELIMEETLLLCIGWGCALLAFLHRGIDGNRILVGGLICCLIPACALGLTLPWPDDSIDLKSQHISASLFFSSRHLAVSF